MASVSSYGSLEGLPFSVSPASPCYQVDCSQPTHHTHTHTHTHKLCFKIFFPVICSDISNMRISEHPNSPVHIYTSCTCNNNYSRQSKAIGSTQGSQLISKKKLHCPEWDLNLRSSYCRCTVHVHCKPAS